MLLIALAGCGLHSNLYIESNDAFRLGENRHGAFRASVVNKGAEAVRITARAGTEDVPLATLEPGQDASVRFEPGETAVFENLGSNTAHLGVRVRGDTRLSMGYANP